MERKLSNLLIKATVSVALFLLVGFFCHQSACSAAGFEPAGNDHRIEAVVINVDKWAVYVPDRVFYFDRNMAKIKIEKLTRAADRLRNKKALITYYSTGGLGEIQRYMLADIVPAAKNRNPQKPVNEALKPPNGSQGKVISKPPGEKSQPNETVSSQSPISHAQAAAFVEALRLAAPHTENPNDGLYSAWKIKAANILRWSKECTGQEMTPAQFEANPQKAREILIRIMGKILREQYAISMDQSVAVRRAASWWLTGDPDQYDTPPTSSYTREVLDFYWRAL